MSTDITITFSVDGRSWLYSQALHASVHEKRPFACHATPAKGSGGYSHWHCQLKRRHTGPHRYRSMQWNDHERVEHIERKP